MNGQLTERPRPVAHVLLVEDDVALRELLAARIDREPDLEVIAQAGSVAEARACLCGVDVAVLDLGLPDGDGRELIAGLRAVSPRAQILIHTASLDQAVLGRMVEDGAVEVLGKPAPLRHVVDTVRRVHRDAHWERAR